MSVVMERGPSTEEASTPPARRRRWPWVVLALVAVTVGALSMGAWAWAAHYQPLRGGGGSYGVLSDDVQVRPVSNTFGDEFILLRPRAADTARALFTITNDGNYPVTVEAVGLDQWLPTDSHVGYLDQTTTLVRVDERFLKTEVFTPREVAPGTSMSMTVTMTFADCSRPIRGSTGVTSLPLTYSAFGMTHTIDLSLGYALTLQNPRQCPSGI